MITHMLCLVLLSTSNALPSFECQVFSKGYLDITAQSSVSAEYSGSVLLIGLALRHLILNSVHKLSALFNVSEYDLV